MLPVMRRIFGIPEALNSLRPTSAWSHTGDDYSGITWMDPDNECPTEEEINEEVARLQAEYDALQYQRYRKENYPSIGDQLDMLYWDKVNGTNTWAEAIANVKSQFPKNT